jgi:hypothetical protein
MNSSVYVLLVFLQAKDLKIIWLSDMLTLSIPQEGYSRNAL